MPEHTLCQAPRLSRRVPWTCSLDPGPWTLDPGPARSLTSGLSLVRYPHAVYSGLTSTELVRLRVSCIRAAHACSEWDTAHVQLKHLCFLAVAQPGSIAELGWGLLPTVAGRARQQAYDERWKLRLLLREPSSAVIALNVAHHCLLSRSFKMAMGEYVRLHKRYPQEPLLLLCVAVSQIQQVMSRVNKDRGQKVLLAFGWLSRYAALRGEQEAAYNMGRAFHHLGISHLAVQSYDKVLEIAKQRSAQQAASAINGGASGGEVDGAADDLKREAAHNLASIYCASGARGLARQMMRSMPV